MLVFLCECHGLFGRFKVTSNNNSYDPLFTHLLNEHFLVLCILVKLNMEMRVYVSRLHDETVAQKTETGLSTFRAVFSGMVQFGRSKENVLNCVDGPGRWCKTG